MTSVGVSRIADDGPDTWRQLYAVIVPSSSEDPVPFNIVKLIGKTISCVLPATATGGLFEAEVPPYSKAPRSGVDPRNDKLTLIPLSIKFDTDDKCKKERRGKLPLLCLGPLTPVVSSDAKEEAVGVILFHELFDCTQAFVEQIGVGSWNDTLFFKTNGIV